MTFLPDGSPFTFPFGPGPAARAIAIGWLDRTQAPTTGSVPDAFVAELRERCAQGVNVTRGRHPCPFCSTREDLALINARSALVGEYMVGHAEIYACDAQGQWYAAPNQIVHYVEAHGYRPPDEFIAAVLARAGDLRLDLSPRMREALARLLRVAVALRRDWPTFVRLPDNPCGDLEEFRRTVYLPLHGAPSTGEVVVPQGDIGPLRDLLDSLDVLGGGGVHGSRYTRENGPLLSASSSSSHDPRRARLGHVVSAGDQVWTLYAGKEVVARLVVTGGDCPWLDARVEACPGLAPHRPLFDAEWPQLSASSGIVPTSSTGDQACIAADGPIWGRGGGIPAAHPRRPCVVALELRAFRRSRR